MEKGGQAGDRVDNQGIIATMTLSSIKQRPLGDNVKPSVCKPSQVCCKSDFANIREKK